VVLVVLAAVEAKFHMEFGVDALSAKGIYHED
jgi:hypothetical protein